MSRKPILFIALVSVLSYACKNLDNADVAPRKTFVRFEEGPYSITASSIESIPGGYVVLGNMQVVDKVNDTTYLETVVFKIDEFGNRQGDLIRSQGGTGKSIKPIVTVDNTLTGFVVVGDSVFTNPFAEQAANVFISSLRVVVLDPELRQVNQPFYISDNVDLSTGAVAADFSGVSIEVTPGKIFILGTVRAGIATQQVAPEEPFIFALRQGASGFEPDWIKTYDLIGRTSRNSRSMHYRDNHLVWASGIAEVTGDFTKSWVSVPVVEENSVFQNFNVIGETSDQLFIPTDIQPSKTGFGYGVTGTFSKSTDGSGGNVFFLRTDNGGNIIPGTLKFFDAINSGSAAIPDSTVSAILDEGEAIIGTKDGGFVLAATMTTNPQKGNGGKDIYLIKVTALGELVWSRTIGGVGDEVPAAIRETESGDLVICGTSTIGDYSSVFIMKTDRNGIISN